MKRSMRVESRGHGAASDLQTTDSALHGADAVDHAALRWADLVMSVLDCPFDPRTVELWSRATGVSGSALRMRCEAVHVTPKAALDFARLLRAVRLAQSGVWDPHSLLDVIDRRTLQALCKRGGLPPDVEAQAPAMETFLVRQQLVPPGRPLWAVKHRLREPSSRAQKGDPRTTGA